MKSLAVAIIGAFGFAVGVLVCLGNGSSWRVGGLDEAVFHYKEMSLYGRDYSYNDSVANEKRSLRHASLDDSREDELNSRELFHAMDHSVFSRRKLDDTSSAVPSTSPTALDTTPTPATPAPTPAPTDAPTRTDRFRFFERTDNEGETATGGGTYFDMYAIMNAGGNAKQRYCDFVSMGYYEFNGVQRFQKSALFRFMNVPSDSDDSPSSSPTVSNSPSISFSPSTSPTVSNSPSISSSPSKAHADW